ncbi:MAG: lipid-A-disaccharide synthase N-terminal domain-containing protein [bacterium]
MEKLWLTLGFIAQGIFAARFLVQWIASERAGRSIVPIGFWFLSISGGLLLCMYAIWRKDPVFILGQSMGVFIYSRNLCLIYRERHNQPKNLDRLPIQNSMKEH